MHQPVLINLRIRRSRPTVKRRTWPSMCCWSSHRVNVAVLVARAYVPERETIAGDPMVVRSKSETRSQSADDIQWLGYGSVAGACVLGCGEKSPRCSRTKLRISCCCPARLSFALTRNRASASRVRNPCEAKTETSSRLTRERGQIYRH